MLWWGLWWCEQKKKRPRSGEEGEAVAERKPEGHTGPVTGVEVDSINSTVISASLDGTLRFWDFKRHRLLDVVTVGVGVSQLELARDSDLLAAACDDFVVRVYDVTTRKLVGARWVAPRHHRCWPWLTPGWLPLLCLRRSVACRATVRR